MRPSSLLIGLMSFLLVLLGFHGGPESGNPAIHWMDAGFLEELRSRAFGSGY